MTREPVLTVENYSKHFQMHEQNKLIPSSRNVNLKVYGGSLTALIGPTGAGKSTVLKGIYRTYLPSGGRMLYRTGDHRLIDLALADAHQIMALRKTEIAFVTQFLHALPRQATEDVVAQPLFQRGVAREMARHKARELLASLKVPERLWGISPATFSGGERQRVNLARGLIACPRLLLLDEPTASLDRATAELVIERIEQLKKDGCAILAIFHHPELIERLADQVVELESPFAGRAHLKEESLCHAAV